MKTLILTTTLLLLTSNIHAAELTQRQTPPLRATMMLTERTERRRQPIKRNRHFKRAAISLYRRGLI